MLGWKRETRSFGLETASILTDHLLMMATLSHILSFIEVDPECTIGAEILSCIDYSLEASGKGQIEVLKPISQWRGVSAASNLLIRLWTHLTMLLITEHLHQITFWEDSILVFMR